MSDKLIVVPKNIEALNNLDYNKASDDELLQISLNEDQFKLLWKSGFFIVINNLANINIDNYEDDKIVDKIALKKIIESNIFDKTFPDYGLNEIKQNIRELFLQSFNNETGIFFFF